MAEKISKRRVSVTLNASELFVLEQLRAEGLNGRTIPEVVRRLLDRKLEEYCEKPTFELRENQ